MSETPQNRPSLRYTGHECRPSRSEAEARWSEFTWTGKGLAASLGHRTRHTLSTGKARKRVRERKVKTKASVQKLANHYQYGRINIYR